MDWDIETACSGEEALARMSENPFDVIVSDMRMPGMNGAELLEKVSQLHPQTIRIVLSGQADKEAVYRAVAPMHQYLSKPCEADVLRDTITRACGLVEMLDSTRSHELLGRISSLPSLPALFQEVMAEIDSLNGSVATVGAIVSKDAAMTAKILQLSNSAMFGVRSPVKSPAQAVMLLGMDNIKSLVLSLQVFKSYRVDRPVPGFSIDQLMAHSLRVATIAKSVCVVENLSEDTCCEAITAGLLHDVGKLILATHAPDDYGAAITKARDEGTSVVEVERQAFGLAHDGIGGYLLALWGIPQTIVEAVAFHHQPEQLARKDLDAAAVIYIANTLANFESELLSDGDQERFHQYLKSLGLLDQVDHWQAAVAQGEEVA